MAMLHGRLDLVLVDVVMPEVNGVDLVRLIREKVGPAEHPVHVGISCRSTRSRRPQRPAGSVPGQAVHPRRAVECGAPRDRDQQRVGKQDPATREAGLLAGIHRRSAPRKSSSAASTRSPATAKRARTRAATASGHSTKPWSSQPLSTLLQRGLELAALQRFREALLVPRSTRQGTGRRHAEHQEIGAKDTQRLDDDGAGDSRQVQVGDHQVESFAGGAGSARARPCRSMPARRPCPGARADAWLAAATRHRSRPVAPVSRLSVRSARPISPPSRMLAVNLRVNGDPVSGTGHRIAVPVFISDMAPVRPVTRRGCGRAESSDMIGE